MTETSIAAAVEILNGTAQPTGVTWYDDASGRWYAAETSELAELVELHDADQASGYSLWCAGRTAGDGYETEADLRR